MVKWDKCFVAGTLITMGDGTYKTIEEIEVGDEVLTQSGSIEFDNDAKQYAVSTDTEEVTEIASPIHDGILEYTFSDGTITRNTSDHPYFVFGKGWCSNVPELTNERYDIVTNELVVQDICLNDVGCDPQLLNIEEVDGEFQTYTFSTNSKNYYANRILVHSEI